MSRIIKPLGAPVVSIAVQMDAAGQVQVSGTRLGVIMSPLETCAVLAQTVGATVAAMAISAKGREIKGADDGATKTAANQND